MITQFFHNLKFRFMLKGTLIDNYYKNGQKQYVYTVSGSAEELESFKKAKGEYYREAANGTPLHWLTEFLPNGMKRMVKSNIALKITVNNTIVIDELKEEVAFSNDVYNTDKGGLAGAVRTELAKAYIRRQFADRPATAPAPAPANAEQQPISSPEELIAKSEQQPADTIASETIAGETKVGP